MKINFPKIIRPLPLSEYAEELTPVMQVWVNPPREFLDSFGMFAEAAKDPEKLEEFMGKLYAWVSELLSQGEPDSKISADELKIMVDETTPTDPQFWGWLQARIIEMIKDHRTKIKNA
jgi:hypothetical protein